MNNSNDQKLIQTLYFRLLDNWNRMDAPEFASLFYDDGNVIGFDGSQVNGRKEIEEHLRQIFADHKVASYIGIIREIRFLSHDIVILRAVAGMVPPGKNDINPAFHGHPELVEQLTNEPRDELQKRNQN